MQTWWRTASELDEDQEKIMDLPADGSFAVSGPPGSGKTNILLMRAAYLHKSSKNIVVLVMNRTLSQFIKTGASEYGIPPENIMTSRQLIAQLASEAGTPLTKGLDWDAGRAEALNILQNIGNKKSTKIYDTILMDEAQDHSDAELTCWKSITRDIYLSADSRQLIYEGGSKDDSFSQLVDKSFVLKYHYRSALEICDLADKIGDSFSLPYTRIAPTSRYPDSSPKSEISVVQAPIQEQAEMIAEKVERQLRAYRGELIGIFCPNKKEIQFIAEYLSSTPIADKLTIQLGDDGYLEMNPDRPICLSTLHGAKGLEFRAVHFAAADTVKVHRAQQKRLAFTGVTRAKTSLSIYHENDLPGYFQAACSPSKDEETPPNWRNVLNG